MNTEEINKKMQTEKDSYNRNKKPITASIIETQRKTSSQIVRFTERKRTSE